MGNEKQTIQGGILRSARPRRYCGPRSLESWPRAGGRPGTQHSKHNTRNTTLETRSTCNTDTILTVLCFRPSLTQTPSVSTIAWADRVGCTRASATFSPFITRLQAPQSPTSSLFSRSPNSLSSRSPNSRSSRSPNSLSSLSLKSPTGVSVDAAEAAQAWMRAPGGGSRTAPSRHHPRAASPKNNGSNNAARVPSQRRAHPTPLMKRYPGVSSWCRGGQRVPGGGGITRQGCAHHTASPLMRRPVSRAATTNRDCKRSQA